MDTQQSTENAQRPTRRARAAHSARPTVKTRRGVQDLMTADEFRQARERFFPSIESLRWHIRVNRKRLADAGAIFIISGKLWFAPREYDQVLLEDGRTRAGAGDE